MKAKHVASLIASLHPEAEVIFSFTCPSCLYESVVAEIVEDSIDADGNLTLLLEDNSN